MPETKDKLKQKEVIGIIIRNEKGDIVVDDVYENGKLTSTSGGKK